MCSRMFSPSPAIRSYTPIMVYDVYIIVYIYIYIYVHDILYIYLCDVYIHIYIYLFIYFSIVDSSKQCLEITNLRSIGSSKYP